MLLRNRLPAFLAAALALTACNSPDRAVTPAADPKGRGADFARDMTALKAQGLPEAEREEAIRALLARYGQAPAYVPPAIVEEPETEPAAEPLAKSAVATSWKTVKTTTFDFPYVIKMDVNILSGESLTAWTRTYAGHEYADPFLLAYYQNSGPGGSKAYQIRVVGFSDDAEEGSLNGRFEWTNNTGVAKLVSVICFAFTPSTGGPMQLFVKSGGLPYYTTRERSLNVSGIAKYDNEAGNFPCLGPTNTRVSLSLVSGSFALNHTVLAVNSKTLTGALVRASNQTKEVGSVIASGHPNLFLTFVPWQSFDVNDGVTRYTARQQNAYACDLQ